ncbi:MAG: sulfatase [Bryobacter sp.]|jgi:N-sulfoglucosamine sulfohydrolase|nr:sulfatase [Bryobacter sp.]
MLRRTFLSSPAAAALQPRPKRPNFLFITADDLGLNLSCYGEKRFSTPNIDRLAGSGARFTTAYVVQASCSPSRSGMFTGLYPHSNGQYGLANTGYQLHENLRDKTIPALLKPAGYRTGIIGKLHVEPEASFPWDHRKKGNTTRQVRTVAPEAAEFIRASGNDPFFLMVNFSDPHAFRNEKDPTGWDFPPQIDGLPEKPLSPGPDTLFNWQGIDTPEQRIRTAGYFNAIQRLDTGVGLLMETLEKSGNADNTVVVFCGDHGPPFARGKTTVYESGVRIPFFLRWPGVTKPNTVSPRMVSTVDILPTILDAAGLPTPGKLHGDSLRKAVTNGPWREFLAAEFHYHGMNPFYPRRAIRDTRYHLIHNLLAGRAKPSTGIDGDPAMKFSRDPRYDGTPVRRTFDTFADPPEFELYDLAADPIEFSNVAGNPAHAAAERRLKDALLAWRKQTNDPFLDDAFTQKMLREGAPASRKAR